MSEWTWEYENYDPAAEQLCESLCTLGNGYFATHDAVPGSKAGLVHCPGIYAAGCYNRLKSTAAGRPVVNEDLVNLPNWLLLRFRLLSADGPAEPWFSPDNHALLDHWHTLDLRRATLTRTFCYRGSGAGLLSVEQTRLVNAPLQWCVRRGCPAYAHRSGLAALRHLEARYPCGHLAASHDGIHGARRSRRCTSRRRCSPTVHSEPARSASIAGSSGRPRGSSFSSDSCLASSRWVRPGGRLGEARHRPAQQMRQVVEVVAEVVLRAPAPTGQADAVGHGFEQFVARLGPWLPREDSGDRGVEPGQRRVQDGVESTIVDTTSDTSSILRPGGVTREDLEAVLGHPLAVPSTNRVRVPG